MRFKSLEGLVQYAYKQCFLGIFW